MRYLLVLIVSLAMFSSCLTPKQRVINKRNKAKNKIVRLIDKHDIKIDTLKEVRFDTIITFDTLVLEEVSIDSQWVWQFDTTYVFGDENLQTFLRITTDTVYVESIVGERDTVIEVKEVIRTVTKTVMVDTTKEDVCNIKILFWRVPCWIPKLLIALAVILLLFFLGKFIKKKIAW